MVVAKEYQNRGLGTNIIKLSIKNAKIKKEILFMLQRPGKK